MRVIRYLGQGEALCLISGCWQQALYLGAFGNSWDWTRFSQLFQSIHALTCHCVCHGRVSSPCDDLTLICVYLCGGLTALCECGGLGQSALCVCGCPCVCDGLVRVCGGQVVTFPCVWSGSQDWWPGRCWFWDCGFWVPRQVTSISWSDSEDWQFLLPPQRSHLQGHHL